MENAPKGEVGSGIPLPAELSSASETRTAVAVKLEFVSHQLWEELRERRRAHSSYHESENRFMLETCHHPQLFLQPWLLYPFKYWTLKARKEQLCMHSARLVYDTLTACVAASLPTFGTWTD